MKVTLNFDGSTIQKNPSPIGGSFSFVIRDADDKIICTGGKKILGAVTNNQMEYGGLIGGLFNCHTLGATEVLVQSDSQLVINQMRGQWKITKAHIREYVEEAKKEEAKFVKVTYIWVPRARNEIADRIARSLAQ